MKELGVHGDDWYSVKQAAKYLGISRPTLFRWIKQGLISFYKVGGSTRFSRESLDAVVEKTTGSREVERTASRCASCGHSVLVDGKVQGTGNLYFRPAETRFWVLHEGLVPLRARTCAACGYVQMHADVVKLGRLTRDGDGGGTARPVDGEDTTDERTHD